MATPLITSSAGITAARNATTEPVATLVADTQRLVDLDLTASALADAVSATAAVKSANGVIVGLLRDAQALPAQISALATALAALYTTPVPTTLTLAALSGTAGRSAGAVDFTPADASLPHEVRLRQQGSTAAWSAYPLSVGVSHYDFTGGVLDAAYDVEVYAIKAGVYSSPALSGTLQLGSGAAVPPPPPPQTLDHLTLTISSASVVENGSAPTLTLRAWADAAGTVPFTGTLSPAASYSASAGNVATLGASTGVIVLQGPGTDTFTVTAGGKSASVNLTVTAAQAPPPPAIPNPPTAGNATNATASSLTFPVTLSAQGSVPTRIVPYFLINGSYVANAFGNADIAVTVAQGATQQVTPTGLPAGTTQTISFSAGNSAGVSQGAANATGTTMAAGPGSATLYDDYLPQPPHYGHITMEATDFSINDQPAASQPSEWDATVSHYDVVMSGNGQEYRNRSATIKHLPYALNTHLYTPTSLDGMGAPDIRVNFYSDMQAWFNARPQYVFENAFIHRAGGTKSAANRVITFADQRFFSLNLSDAGARAYNMDRVGRIVNDPNNDGVFFDMHDSSEVHQLLGGGEGGNQSTASLEYTDVAVYENDVVSMLDLYRTTYATKLVQINPAEYRSPFDRRMAIAAGGVHLERTNFYGSDATEERWAYVDDLLANDVFVQIYPYWNYDSFETAGATYPPGNSLTRHERGFLWELAAYYACVLASPRKLALSIGMQPWDWQVGLAADVGHPTAARVLAATGNDPNGHYYRIWSRDFDRALVLIRVQPSYQDLEKVYDDTTLVQFPLPAGETWLPLNMGDGSLGAAVSGSIGLRTGEAAILLKQSTLAPVTATAPNAPTVANADQATVSTLRFPVTVAAAGSTALRLRPYIYVNGVYTANAYGNADTTVTVAKGQVQDVTLTGFPADQVRSVQFSEVNSTGESVLSNIATGTTSAAPPPPPAGSFNVLGEYRSTPPSQFSGSINYTGGSQAQSIFAKFTDRGSAADYHGRVWQLSSGVPFLRFYNNDNNVLSASFVYNGGYTEVPMGVAVVNGDAVEAVVRLHAVSDGSWTLALTYRVNGGAVVEVPAVALSAGNPFADATFTYNSPGSGAHAEIGAIVVSDNPDTTITAFNNYLTGVVSPPPPPPPPPPTNTGSGLTGLAVLQEAINYTTDAELKANISDFLGGTNTTGTALYKDGNTARLAFLDTNVLYRGRPTIRYEMPINAAEVPDMRADVPNANALSHVWMRSKIRFSPGFTTTGSRATSNSYKVQDYYWDDRYNGRGTMEITNTDQYQFGALVQAQGNGDPQISNFALEYAGNVVNEWTDGNWYDYIIEYKTTSPTTATKRLWIAIDGQTPVQRATGYLTMNAGYTIPKVRWFVMGGNFNQLRTAAEANWRGPWEMIDGDAHVNPFGLADPI